MTNRSRKIIGGFVLLVAYNNLVWYLEYDKLKKKQPEVSVHDDATKRAQHHHYRFEMRGASTWRFDEATGEACMITSSQAEVGLWRTMQCPPTTTATD